MMPENILRIFPTQPLFNTPAEGVPLGIGNTGRLQETRTMGLPGGEKL